MTDAGAWASPPSTAARMAFGREERRRTSRRALATLSTEGRDPLAILARQNRTRLPELLPLRTQRMAASPFAFFRGAAAVMAADLARDAHTGITVASCGDAHVANFGFYASPQRTLVFDLNDFDEAAWAPWEWDLKRLVTSVVVAGQSTARDRKVVRDAALAAVRTYARTIAASMRRGPTARYFEHFDPQALMGSFDPATRSALGEAMREAQKRTAVRAARKLTERTADGRLVFVERPPTMVHVGPEIAQQVEQATAEYRESANVDIRMVIQQYVVADLARRVVGVGSVGTGCYLVLLQDGDEHALILQTKEAVRSVLTEYGGVAQPESLTELITESGEGARVVALQRTLQAVSDPFLGHLRGASTDYYVRQFHDMKGGIEIETLEDRPFRSYARACAATLARAHAQSPNAAAVAGYVGGGRAVGEAILTWAEAYAELSRADHAAFVAAAT